MSRYARLSLVGSGTPGNDVRGGHGESNCGHAKVKRNVVSQHRKAASATDINLKKLQMIEKMVQNDECPEGMDEAQRLTWQAQWGEALKKVESLRLSGTHSEAWSGIAADIYKPKSQETQGNGRFSNASSLDRWNFYPGPSVTRDSMPQSHVIPIAWNKEFLRGAKPHRDPRSSLLKGRGSKSSTFRKVEPPSAENIIRDDSAAVEQKGGSTTLDQLNERPERYSVLATRVQRTQSGRKWGQKPDANYASAPVLKPILKKAISMREGGAHQDAVLKMARAYTDTVCGVPKTLECASCGRNLGIIVQGNPGVDIAFCQACRPSPEQWKKPIADPAAGSRRKKNVLVQFCRKILHLDNSKKSK